MFIILSMGMGLIFTGIIMMWLSHMAYVILPCCEDLGGLDIILSIVALLSLLLIISGCIVTGYDGLKFFGVI
jgi:hypothetical protein